MKWRTEYVRQEVMNQEVESAGKFTKAEYCRPCVGFESAVMEIAAEYPFPA